MRVCRACTGATDESGRFCPACGAVLADEPPDPAAATPTGSLSSSVTGLIGQTIDGFRIDAVLGGGAFGTVYRGHQLGLDRPVALKVPTHEIAADPVMARRFAREARSAARVTHPGVVAIYAVGELADGRPYLAMQLIDGEPLDGILASGPIPTVRALRIARLIATALAETHVAGVIHRDLKPSNIVWRRDRHGDDLITIVDFGIAVAKPGNADATRLTAGGLIGTPHYMSPEQAQGEQVDGRADLYALGCIVFELVTGRPPYEGSGFEVLLAHLGRPLPAPSELNEAVPEIVDDLVMHLMAKKPDDRPQSADEVVTLLDAAIAQLAGGPPAREGEPRPARARRKTAQPTTLERPRPRPQPRTRRNLLAALGVLAITAAGFTAVKLTRGSGDAVAGQDVPADALDPTTPSPFTGRVQRVFDDGEMAARATLYDPIVAGTRVRTQIEIWNAIGPLDRPQLIVTIEDPDGKATGVAAVRSKRAPGRFAFHHVFPQPGHYVLRVFPPEAASVFTIEIDVEKP